LKEDNLFRALKVIQRAIDKKIMSRHEYNKAKPALQFAHRLHSA